MSAAAYDLGHFEFEQEAPPYLPNAPPPIYKMKSCVPHDHHLSAVGGVRSPGAGPDDARLSGFDLAESIWSQDSDLTLDDLALSFDSTSSRSSMSSHWFAPPLTPPTSRHSDLHPPLDPVASPAETPVQESEPEEPDSPAPAYSRDPLGFDPAILASLDPQLRLRPFEAFEDMWWTGFSDSAPVEVALSSQSQTATMSLNHQPSISCTSFTADSAFSDTSTTTMLAPALPYPPDSPPPSPSQPPPAYLASASKPLPNIPPSSPIRPPMAEHAQHSPSVVMTFKSPIVSIENLPIVPSTPVEGVRLIPLRPQTRPRSKSVGGPKTVQRLTTAIARLRGRE